MTESLSLAYSPCPNDTFIFAAWTRGFLADAPSVSVVLDDVEALNQAAREGRHALTKVSYGAIPALLKHYRILRSGGALGRGCGPLVIARPGMATSLSTLPEDAVIAIPGEMTTAFLLLQLSFGRKPRTKIMRFDAIVDAVKDGTVDAGLIIHESRFTYQTAGLISIADLGEWWEATSGLPIPLGAILIRRDIDARTAARINETIRASLRYAYEHPADVAPYIREHAFEMDDKVMQAHIALYVNPYSDTLGADGEAAVNTLFERGIQAGLLPPGRHAEFV